MKDMEYALIKVVYSVNEKLTMVETFGVHENSLVHANNKANNI